MVFFVKAPGNGEAVTPVKTGIQRKQKLDPRVSQG